MTHRTKTTRGKTAKNSTPAAAPRSAHLPIRRSAGCSVSRFCGGMIVVPAVGQDRARTSVASDGDDDRRRLSARVIEKFRRPTDGSSKLRVSSDFRKRGKTRGGMILQFAGGRGSEFILGMSQRGDLDGLSHAELKGLVVKQWEEMVELQRMVVALRDEIARLKGGSGRAEHQAERVEQATEPKPPGEFRRSAPRTGQYEVEAFDPRGTAVKVAAHQTPMSKSFTV